MTDIEWLEYQAASFGGFCSDAEIEQAKRALRAGANALRERAIFGTLQDQPLDKAVLAIISKNIAQVATLLARHAVAEREHERRANEGWDGIK